MEGIKSLAGKSLDAFRHRYLSVVFRLTVGIVFIVSAAGKLSTESAFVDEVAKYDLLPNSLAEAYGAALPWVEITIGVLLIIGFSSKFYAGIAVLTSLSFIIANSIIIYRGLNLACGCFGNAATLQTREAIIIDCVLLIMAIQILARRGDFLSLDMVLLRKRSPEHEED